MAHNGLEESDLPSLLVTNVEKILSKLRDENKQLLEGKKILLCGSSREINCTSKCADLSINEKCGYHQRASIQEFLFTIHRAICYVLDDHIKGTDDIIESEKEVIKSEKIDLIIVFMDTSGPHLEFQAFREMPEFAEKMILFIKEEFYPFYGKEGVLTNEIKKFIFKQRGITIIIKKDNNIYNLVEEVLLLYFRNN